MAMASSTLLSVNTAQVSASWIPGIDNGVFIALMCILLAEVAIILGQLGSIYSLLGRLGYSLGFFGKGAYNKKLTLEDIDKQNEAVMTDHEYDGIRELDNNLPPWWKYGFYFTIVFAVIYLINYHVTRTAPLQLQEYKQEMAEAEVSKSKQLKTESAGVDENTVTELNDPALIASGLEIFKGNCASCHGQNGEGGVGPNLTDEYWLHGGGIKNVFKVIKYGVPEKGMISWQQSLKPEAIQKVASYILTLHGSKPANAKEPQGEIWKETVDSTSAASASNATP